MRGWGLGYFRVNPEGHVTVHPDQAGDRAVDLYRLALDLDAQGVGLPLLLRFSDILQARIAVSNSPARALIRDLRMSEKRSRSGSPTPWAFRSIAS